MIQISVNLRQTCSIFSSIRFQSAVSFDRLGLVSVRLLLPLLFHVGKSFFILLSDQHNVWLQLELLDLRCSSSLLRRLFQVFGFLEFLNERIQLLQQNETQRHQRFRLDVSHMFSRLDFVDV